MQGDAVACFYLRVAVAGVRAIGLASGPAGAQVEHQAVAAVAHANTSRAAGVAALLAGFVAGGQQLDVVVCAAELQTKRVFMT